MADLMADRYGVIGWPVAHSKSPFIHAAFAAQTGQQMHYERIEGQPEDFEAQVAALADAGWRGLNVTLPFKERAFGLTQVTTATAERGLAPGEATLAAALAGAANTLWFEGGRVHADNTDGVGLMRDLEERLGLQLAGMRVLVLGAGGAVSGIFAPLLQRAPACLHLVNRTQSRADQLVSSFGAGLSTQPRVAHLLHASRSALEAFEARVVAGLADGSVAVHAAPVSDAMTIALPPYDLILNGTSGGLTGARMILPAGWFAAHTVAYDLAYRADGPTVFMQQAQAAGAGQVHDGLGMLVEQAAAAFQRWRGVQVQTAPVLSALQAALRDAA